MADTAATPAPSTPGMISSAQLCNLTKLSDRRHRQLAGDGYFPLHVRGKGWQFVPTIQGLFRYYQERSDSEIGDKVKFEAHRKLKLINDQNAGALIELATVEKQLHEIASSQLKVLRQRLESEWPLAVSSMDVPQARIYGKRLVDEICAEMRSLVSKWES